MKSRPKRWLPVAAAFSAAVVCSSTRPAEACSQAAYGWSASVSKVVPENGSVIVSLACYWQCPALPDPPVLTIRDLKTDETVAGSVTASGMNPATPETIATAWITWKPAAHFVAGDYYRLSDEGSMAGRFSNVAPDAGPDVIGDFSVTVATTAAEITPQSLTRETAEVVAIDQGLGTPVCCETGMDSCGGSTSCFATRFNRSARLQISFDTTWEQYLYRIAFRDGPAAGPWD